MSVVNKECDKECNIVECWFKLEDDIGPGELHTTRKYKNENFEERWKNLEHISKTYLLNSYLINVYNSIIGMVDENVSKHASKICDHFNGIGLYFNIYKIFIALDNLPKRINEIFNEERKGVTQKRKNFIGKLKRFAPFDTKEWRCINEPGKKYKEEGEDEGVLYPWFKPTFKSAIGPFLYFKFEIPKTLIKIDNSEEVNELTHNKLNALILTLESVVSEAISEIPFPINNTYNLKTLEHAKALFCIFNGEEKGLYEEVEGDDEYDCCFDEDSYREILKK